MSVDSLTRPFKPKRRKFKLPYIQREDISNIIYHDAEDNKNYKPPKRPYQKPAYPYRKLEGTDIRLLRIVPGTGAIECLLHQIPLEELGESSFYTLSYVWGDMTEQETIILDGQPFQVTRNLFRALHQFRERPYDIGFPEDYFWIDAICINQEDIDERSQQVQRMFHIYSVGLTVVWLGPIRKLPKDDPSKKTSRNARSSKYQVSQGEAIEILFKKARSMWNEWEPIDENDNLIINTMLGHAHRAVMDAMLDVLQRPWWGRIWTLQESCLGASCTIYVGHHSVHLRYLIGFFKYFLEDNKIICLSSGSTRMTAIQRIEDLYWSVHHDKVDGLRGLQIGEVLAQILGVSGVKKSTNPQDQIYGLLGMLKHITGEELPDELLPNYHLSYSETYWTYAAFLFQSAKDLHLLSCSRNELQGVPSWVTDFRYLSMGLPMPEPSVYVTPDKRVLHLQGCILGTFRNVLPGRNSRDLMPRREKIPVELTTHLKAFEEHILKPAASTRGITIEEVFNDMIEDTTRIIYPRGNLSFYEVYIVLRDSSRSRRSRTAKKRRTRNIRLKEEAIADQLTGTCLLLYDGSLLRVRREDIKVRTGDLICLFKGSNEPFLLRTSDDNFTLLSPCIVNGGPLKRELNDNLWTSPHIQDIKLI